MGGEGSAACPKWGKVMGYQMVRKAVGSHIHGRREGVFTYRWREKVLALLVC